MHDKYCECEYCSSQGEISECWALIKIAALEAKIVELRDVATKAAETRAFTNIGTLKLCRSCERCFSCYTANDLTIECTRHKLMVVPKNDVLLETT